MPVSRLRRVARLAAPVLALALGAALAFGLVSCGGRDRSGLLAGTTAQQILANLDQVRADAAAGDCSAAAAEVATVEDQIAALPTSVDARLRSRLGEGARRLAVIVDSPGACTTASTAATQSSTTPSTTPASTHSRSNAAIRAAPSST